MEDTHTRGAPVTDAPGGRPTHLPSAASRWLSYAVRPGAEQLRHAELRMHGEILVGRWRPFRAHQVLDPGDGFTWAATAGRGPLAIRGWDRYIDGAGAMRWTVLGIPVMRASGADVSRSAAGRLAGETVLSPAFARDPRVRWEGGDDDHATFRVRVGSWDHEVTLTVDARGGLVAVDMPRWGDPRGEGYAMHGFHVACAGAVTHMGITIPGAMRAGWRDPDGGVREFFRATIDAATFR
ncbi:MAG TPA: DUF6544 family protein [Miltoncostaea sp.]|nr:DUF6544 family protein [Miltoncostaea sp.]